MRRFIQIFSVILASLAATFIANNNRAEGGDFSNLNSVLTNLILNLALSIEPKLIEFPAGPLTIPLLATIGESGVCVDLKINDGGDVYVTSQLLDELSENGDQVFEIEIFIDVVQFSCTVPLMVEIEGSFPDFVNTIDGFGDLTFVSGNASLSQKILAESPDFKKFAPSIAYAGNCSADPGLLAYTGDSLGEILTFDITDIIIGELETDPSYVFNDVALELCKLGVSFADQIASILTNDLLSNTSSPLYIPNAFVEDDDGVVPVLKLEENLKQDKPEAIPGLLDLEDDKNFFVDLLIAEDNSEPAIVNNILDGLTDPNNEINADPVMIFASNLLDIELADDGSFQDIDLLEVLDTTIEAFFNYSINNTIFATLDFEMVDVFLDVIPPAAEVEGEDPPFILPPFLAFSKQTAMLESIRLDRIYFSANFKLDLNIVNKGVPGNSFLENPFDLIFEEDVIIQLDWVEFLGTIGLFFAVNADYVKETNFGSLIDGFFIECALSWFPFAPAVAGVRVDHETILLDISTFKDAIFVLAGDVIEVAVEVYQSVIPRGLEYLLDAVLVNEPFFEETSCPVADPGKDDLAQFPYNFGEGLFKTLSESVNAEVLNDLAQAVNIEDNGIYIVGDKDGYEKDEGTGFEIPFPVVDGWRQNMTVYIQAFSIQGFLLPYFREAVLFKVDESSEYSPQYLNNILNVGIPEDTVALEFILNITIEDAYPDEETNIEGLGSAPSYYTPQRNLLNITFTADNADIILDLYLKFTEFDVTGFQLQEIINLGCWASRLDYPGGISLMEVNVEGIHTTVECDCENEMVRRMGESFANPSSFPEQEIFLDDVLTRVGFMLMNLFDYERFPLTKNISQQICDTLDYDKIGNNTVYVFHESHGEITSLLPYMTFFLFAVLTPTLIARLLNKYGPKFDKINKHHKNLHINKDIMSKAKLANEENEVDHSKHLETPMYKNPLIGWKGRVLIPLIIFINLILFIVGDTGDAVRINVEGHFFLIPYEATGFRTLSVISSVIELFRSGGWLLGILLLVLSILWPYVKLIIMAFCWYLPPSKLSVGRRGKIIEYLDFFGRFSFAEFHFLVFVLVVFQIDAGTPDNTFLPSEDFFLISLVIEPLISLFTFSLAVVVSIMVSNALLVYQHNIEDQSRIKIREEELEQIGSKSLNEAVHSADNKSVRISNWTFSVNEFSEDEDKHYQYKYKLTKKAIFIAATSVIIATVFLLAAAVATSLRIELSGFFAYLVKFAGAESTYELSVYDLLIVAYKTYSGDMIVYFVGMVFILTIAIIPMLQTILLLVLLFKSVSLKRARQLTEAHHVMSVWCCVDVFVLAVTLTVLELPTVTSGLSENLEFCDELGLVMQTFLEPMRYVTQADVDAACIGMKSSITAGGYVAVFSVFTLNVVNFIISRLYYTYIADRESIEPYDEVGNAPRFIKAFHKRMEFLGLISIDINSDIAASEINRKELSVSQYNPMFQEDEKKPKSSFSQIRISNPLFRASQTQESKPNLTKQLTDFYKEVDPNKVRRVAQEVKIAQGTPDGIQKLNKRLVKRYGRGISIDIEF